MIVHTGRFSGDDALKFPFHRYLVPTYGPIDRIRPSSRSEPVCNWRISYAQDPYHLAHRVEGVIVPSRYSHARTSRHVLSGWLDPGGDPRDPEVVNMHLKMILDRG